MKNIKVKDNFISDKIMKKQINIKKEIDLIQIVLRVFKSFRLPNDIRLNEKYESIVHYQNDLKILLIDQIFRQIHNKIKEIKQKGLNKYRIPVLLYK